MRNKRSVGAGASSLGTAVSGTGPFGNSEEVSASSTSDSSQQQQQQSNQSSSTTTSASLNFSSKRAADMLASYGGGNAAPGGGGGAGNGKSGGPSKSTKKGVLEKNNSSSTGNTNNVVSSDVKEGAERLAKELDEYLAKRSSKEKQPNKKNQLFIRGTDAPPLSDESVADLQLATARKLREVGFVFGRIYGI